MRQRVSVREHFRRGNAATTLIVALQAAEQSPKKTLFGPPANLPLPPKEAVIECKNHPMVQLDSTKWPVPFPMNPFIWILGTKRNESTSPDTGANRMGMHELHTVYADQEAYAQFQLWVIGAPVNTIKSGGSSPTKAISGSAG
jgi:hypothetical protein